eukprot:10240168-Lingulodinium_polyedra.AAC.1
MMLMASIPSRERTHTAPEEDVPRNGYWPLPVNVGNFLPLRPTVFQGLPLPPWPTSRGNDWLLSITSIA